MATDTATGVVADNPFIGPVPFPRRSRAQFRFFGRQREIQELVSYVLSQPIVLLYSPSGAGKSSLMNAGIIPELEDVHRFQVLPVARVRGRTDVERADTMPCFYTYQAILEMDPTVSPDSAASLTLADFLARYPRPEEDGEPIVRVLVFDQFEEILAIYSSRSPEHQRAFFLQVGEALRTDPLLRVVWLVREDRVSQLEVFAGLLPYGLGLRYRLDHLSREAALQAVIQTARASAKPFSTEAAETLVGELMKTRAEIRPGHFELIDGTRVEPVQLQVVCRSIWEQASAGEITASELPRFGDIEDVLAAYYDDVVRSVVVSSPVDEGTLREWFSTRLVTALRTRGTVFRGPTHTDDVIPVPNDVVDELEARHIIRGEERADGGGRWYELVHDTFIAPILIANVRWRTQRERRALTWLRAAVPPVVVALVAALGWPVVSPAQVVADPLTSPPFTGTVDPGQQDLYPVHVDRAEGLAIGADEATGRAVQLEVRASDGSVHEIGAVDLDPGPAVRAHLTDLPAGDYQVVVEGHGDAPTDYEVWVATGRELSTTPGGGRYDGELSGPVAGPFLLFGTGASVDLTAHSAAFDTVLTVQPLGDPDKSRKLTNDDYSLDCQGPGDWPATPGSYTPESNVPGLNWTDSRLSFSTLPGEVYQIYVQPLDGAAGPYWIGTFVGSTGRALAAGQPLRQEIPAQGATQFDLPDGAADVSVETTGGSAVELTVNSGGRAQFTECISPHDLAGARLALTAGPDRTLLVRNLAATSIAVIVTAT